MRYEGLKSTASCMTGRWLSVSEYLCRRLGRLASLFLCAVAGRRRYRKCQSRRRCDGLVVPFSFHRGRLFVDVMLFLQCNEIPYALRNSKNIAADNRLICALSYLHWVEIVSRCSSDDCHFVIFARIGLGIFPFLSLYLEYDCQSK